MGRSMPVSVPEVPGEYTPIWTLIRQGADWVLYHFPKGKLTITPTVVEGATWPLFPGVPIELASTKDCDRVISWECDVTSGRGSSVGWMKTDPLGVIHEARRHLEQGDHNAAWLTLLRFEKSLKEFTDALEGA